jgi:hypothetical protein
MPSLGNVCRRIRSKNAGPFWITVDIAFNDADSFAKYANSSALGPENIATLFAVDERMVKHFSIPEMNLIKISFPRRYPQGGVVERDMHSGQQYIRLLDLEI